MSALEAWSSIVIPSVGAAGTIGAAVAAWITSVRALRIAQDGEQRAEREQIRREAEEQAKLLVGWVEYLRSGFGVVPSGGVPPVIIRRVEVVSALEVSRVPGALEILRLTQHDFDAPRVTFGTGSLVNEQYAETWHRRTIQRISSWSLNPARALVDLTEEISIAEKTPRQYAQLNLGEGWDDVYNDEQPLQSPWSGPLLA